MKKIEIYTWARCPFCVRAKQLLEARGLEFTEHVMDARSADLREIKQKYGHSTVPIVLIDDEFVGGYDELSELDAAGRLVAG